MSEQIMECCWQVHLGQDLSIECRLGERLDRAVRDLETAVVERDRLKKELIQVKAHKKDEIAKKQKVSAMLSEQHKKTAVLMSENARLYRALDYLDGVVEMRRKANRGIYGDGVVSAFWAGLREAEIFIKAAIDRTRSGQEAAGGIPIE